jgi:transketolase
MRLMEKIKNHKGHQSLLALRPADAIETSVAWDMALKNTTTPTALILSRQNVKDIPASGTSRYQEASEAKNGGYLVKSVTNPDITLFANGSEVATLVDAASILEKENNLKVNVASIISEGLFKQQSAAYQDSVIPKGKLIFGLTAGLPVNLQGLIGDSGKVVGLDHFGYSAPASVLDQKFGFTSENISKEILKYIEESK